MAFELARLIHDEDQELGQGFDEGPGVGRDTVGPSRRFHSKVFFVSAPVPSRLSEGDVEVSDVPASRYSGAMNARRPGTVALQEDDVPPREHDELVAGDDRIRVGCEGEQFWERFVDISAFKLPTVSGVRPRARPRPGQGAAWRPPNFF